MKVVTLVNGATAPGPSGSNVIRSARADRTGIPVATTQPSNPISITFLHALLHSIIDLLLVSRFLGSPSPATMQEAGVELGWTHLHPSRDPCRFQLIS